MRWGTATLGGGSWMVEGGGGVDGWVDGILVD